MKTARPGGEEHGLALSTALAIRYALTAFVPVAVLAAALAPSAVQVAYGRGAFDAADATVTSAVIAGFAPLLLALMVSPILTSAHNALRHGRVLLATGAINVVLNLVLDLTLGRSWCCRDRALDVHHGRSAHHLPGIPVEGAASRWLGA